MSAGQGTNVGGNENSAGGPGGGPPGSGLRRQGRQTFGPDPEHPDGGPYLRRMTHGPFLNFLYRVNWTIFEDVEEAITTEEKWKAYIQDLHKPTLAFGGFSVILGTWQLNSTSPILDYTNEMSASILVMAVALVTYALVTSAYCYLRLGRTS